MRAISLWEPWGSAIRLKLKRNETRGWSTGYRGPLLIHCAKTKNYADYILLPQVATAFQAAGVFRTTQLHFGCPTCRCELVDCVRTEEMMRRGIDPLEFSLGNYDPGRFAWVLENIVPLPQPIPFRGAQGFFDVPDEVLAKAERSASLPYQDLLP